MFPRISTHWLLVALLLSAVEAVAGVLSFFVSGVWLGLSLESVFFSPSTKFFLPPALKSVFLIPAAHRQDNRLQANRLFFVSFLSDDHNADTRTHRWALFTLSLKNKHILIFIERKPVKDRYSNT